MLAYTLEIDPELLPFIPELLTDFEELGSDADEIVAAVASLALAADSTVVDLGCGKGAVGIEIADSLGFRVTGIDLFEPFIAICEAAAEEAGVHHLCEFRHGNVAKLAGELPPFDVAIFAALGDVLGPLDETIRILRDYVRPGGYILINDGFIEADKRLDFSGFAGYVGREETLLRLTRWNDELVYEKLFPSADGLEQGQVEAEAILKRAQGLALRHPELADRLLAYAQDQADEYGFLAENLTGAIWVFRKAAGSEASRAAAKP